MSNIILYEYRIDMCVCVSVRICVLSNGCLGS